MIVQSIGKTAEGRDQLMAIITSPENHKQLAQVQGHRPAAGPGRRADRRAGAGSSPATARRWCGSTAGSTPPKCSGAQQLTETVYQLVSRTDEETMRFLRDVIILAVHANPDGMELVSDWYMRNSDQTKRETNAIPRLYQKYIGHDNNRDFYMSAQPESINMNHQLYREWFPQIMYNHHQTGPTGTVLFAPPFRDPANYVYHPLVVTGLDVVGAAMHNRFVAENKPGATMRRGSNYSTWWNGGLRTTVYFHNMIGLLTESIGHPTPMEVAFVPDRQIMSGDLPFPIEPQTWHFRQSIEYSITANWAVLDVASRNRETFLFNIYKMGKDSIEKGSKDTWTVYPRRLQAVKDEIARGRGAAEGGDARMVPGGLTRNTVPLAQYESLMKKPDWRDPRAYILPASEGDFLTSAKFVEHAAQDRRGRASRHRAVQRRRQAVSGRVLRREDVAGVPAARPRHVRAAGSPERLPVSGRAADSALRQRRLDARLSDGRQVRSRAGRRRRRVRGDSRRPEADAGRGDRCRRRGRVRRRPSLQRRVHRREPAAQGRRGGAVRRRSQLAESRWHRRDVRAGQGVDGGGAAEGGDGSRPVVPRRQGTADGRHAQAGQAAHRAVGSLRRRDPVGLGALDPRAVRVRLRGGVPADARCRQSQGEVRRAAVSRWRHPRAGRRGQPDGRVLRPAAASRGYPGRSSATGWATSPPSRRCRS